MTVPTMAATIRDLRDKAAAQLASPALVSTLDTEHGARIEATLRQVVAAADRALVILERDTP